MEISGLNTRCKGLSGDLPEHGSFFTNDDLGKPILCTRDQSGDFHAWSYSPKGELEAGHRYVR